MKELDWEIVFFLFGLFIMVEGLSHKGILLQMAKGMTALLGGSKILTILVILWFATLLSGVIDNIAVTVVLIPIISSLLDSPGLQPVTVVILTTLIIGINLGGNLTPMASPTTVLAMSLSKKTEEELTPKKFFKIGFSTTLLQGSIATVFLLFMLFLTFTFGVGIIIINFFTLLIAIFCYFFLYSRQGNWRKILKLPAHLGSFCSRNVQKVIDKLQEEHRPKRDIKKEKTVESPGGK